MPIVYPVEDRQKAAAIVQQGLALHQQGQPLQAEPFYRQALDLCPREADALHLLGVVLSQKGQQSEAEALVHKALEENPHHTAYHNSLGRILLLQGRFEEGLVSLEEALRLTPQNPEAHFNLGEAYLAQNHPGRAEKCYRRALELKPTHAPAAFGLGRSLWAQGDQPGALPWFQLASLLEANNPTYLNQLGVAYMVLRHNADAQKTFDALLKLVPDNADALANIAVLAYHSGQREQACDYYARALALKPDMPSALDGYIEARRQLCLWDDLDSLQDRIVSGVRSRLAIGQPASIRSFTALYLPFTPEEQLRIARDESRTLATDVGEPLWGEPAGETVRLRIGYLTSDARNHPIGNLLAEMFRLHDRERFEIFVYSTGPDDGSPIRQTILLGAEHFREAKGMTSPALAEMIAADGVHILVDLMGHTADTRMAVLARRPAPIQMHYLGFPGSTGAEFVDYLITDTYISPPDHLDLLTESPIYLPVYQINGHRYLEEKPTPDYSQFGIVDSTFLFYSFNNNYKFSPEIFDVWMRILKRVPKAKLALLATSQTALNNLQKEAEKRGINSQRILFAGYMAQPDNIARQRLMHLFLDTPYYNAGATATDALWAGVPLLTVEGHTYISRVAGSLLTHLGLSELIMPDLQSYEDMAVTLAEDHERLQSLRGQLAVAKQSALLFDTERQLRHLERAFETCWERFTQGEAASPLTVVP
ncbi:tetratricopeptide repeat protein [Acidithiobacillus sp. MC6.1]|nr:tetratricopeptide repeat protein [Acidithiobacillus sp. MC6.1]